ncbi:MAG TPA: biotin carboxylase N-terminal domain-containing protein [Streptosporangiaceae bacterium]|nr:biotin carboxylase N-terminal domain-containing protein [Streptosporangiaceae bacterium]
MILRRVLIANRGEIAVRVIRTCRRLGIETVLTVATGDADSVPARLADKTIAIGSYLDVDEVIRAAATAGAGAIHPGYGFLSENPRLARACEAAGIAFIGPGADVLEAAGDKLAARNHAVAAGLPVLPGGLVRAEAEGEGGAAGEIAHAADAAGLAERIGYPVLVKAAGGGGGRGLRVVRDPADLAGAVAMGSAEAQAAFGDGRVYLERYVSPARHVEVQLLGDGENVIHLGDRDCSVQRRYQKLIEEAPAPRLGETLRVGMRAAAVAFGLHLKYQGLGTVEFLVDAARSEFWFLEVNARIQVEHPVTEAVTGLDLVAEQIAVAEGRRLGLSQASVRLDGHAIECRINAEDPAAGFRPSPGRVTSAVFPAGPGIRVDTHIQAGSAVPPQYDSLLAKLVVSGASRAEALGRLRGALARCEIGGVATTLPVHAALAADDEFAAGGFGTDYLARWLELRTRPVRDKNG